MGLYAHIAAEQRTHEHSRAAAGSAEQHRVLVFNFFAGVKDRGIPIYTQGLIEALGKTGAAVFELRCPQWLKWLPGPLLNAAFVFFEQVIAPLVRLRQRCSLTIYPYNSAGMIDAVLGRSVVVIHDLIPNLRSQRQFSARYIRFTQMVQRQLHRDLAAASVQTLNCLRRLRAFAQCPLHLWSNPFYAHQAAAARVKPVPALPAPRSRLRVLLCTGLGRNKDYAGAIRLFRSSRVLADAELRIVGFGDEARLALRRIRRLPPQVRQRITVLSRLTLDELSAEYHASDLVWVHSLKEGFGRSAVEARIHGRRVLASDISSFRRMRWLGLTLYRAESFEACIANALGMPESALDDAVVSDFHRLLEQSLEHVLDAHLRKSRRPAKPRRRTESGTLAGALSTQALTARKQTSAQVIVLDRLHRKALLEREARRNVG